MACLTCDLFSDYSQQVDSYAEQAFTAVGPGLYMLVNGAAYLWGAYIILLAVIGSERFKLNEILREALWFIFAITIVQNPALWWEPVHLLTELAGFISVKMFNLSSAGADESGVASIVRAIETGIWDNMKANVYSILQNANIFTGFGNFLMGMLLIVVLFVLTMRLYLSFVVSLVIIYAAYVLSPFALAMAAFPMSRQPLQQVFNHLLAASFRLIVTGASAGLILKLMGALYSSGPANMSNGVDVVAAGSFFFSDAYWKIVIYCISFTVLHSVVEHVASAIAGTMSPGARMPHLPRPSPQPQPQPATK